MFTFRKPTELTPEVERRIKRDLAEAVVHYRKNFDALREGTELIAGLCDRLAIDHGLGDIIEKLREPVQAPEELPHVNAAPAAPNLTKTRDLTKAVSFVDERGNLRTLNPGEFIGLDYQRPAPKTEPTAFEMSLILKESGCHYKPDWQEHLRLGRPELIEFADLPSSQRFRRRFNEVYLRYCPGGDADTALANLGYRGFLGPLDAQDEEPFPNPYQTEAGHSAPAAAKG
jgi:hypothetical protein